MIMIMIMITVIMVMMRMIIMITIVMMMMKIFCVFVRFSRTFFNVNFNHKKKILISFHWSKMTYQSLPSFTLVFGEEFSQSTILLANEYSLNNNSNNNHDNNSNSTLNNNSVPLYNSGKFIFKILF